MVNAGFLTRLTATSSSRGPTSPFKGSSASVSDIQDGLRLGARRLANSVSYVNNSISALSLGRDTLRELDGIVTKVVKIARQAERADVSSQDRERLQGEFRRLSKSFEKVIEKVTGEEINLLSSDGLSEVLANVGLDPKSATAIGDIFKKFRTVEGDKLLADEAIKGPRPIPRVPSNQTREVTTTVVTQTTVLVPEAPNLELLDNLSTYTVATGQHVYAAADFDGDGDNDLISHNSPATQFVYLENQGDGTFSTPTTFSSGTTATHTLAADFDEDGVIDLVVSDTASGFVRYLRGNGDGSFAAPTTVSTASQFQPGRSVVFDYDNDGHLDVAVVNFQGPNVRIYRGNGDGSFADGNSIATGDPTLLGREIATGDFNNDGYADLVVGYTDKAYANVFFGNGSSFAPASALASLSSATDGISDITVGDFNGDGSDDIALNATTDGVVRVHLSDGAGGFAAGTSYGTSGRPLAIESGDLNGDGIIDLAYTSETGSSVSIRLGQGDGTFGAAISRPVGTSGVYLTIAELNGDGRNDLVVMNSGTSTLRLFESDVQFTPQSVTNTQTFTTTVPVRNGPIREYTELFSPDRSLRTRNEAIAVRVDAEALQAQIRKNIKVIDDTLKEVGKGLELVRAAGFGLLEVADSIQGSASADKVASLVKRAILGSRGVDSRRAGYLDSIVSATLLAAPLDKEA